MKKHQLTAILTFHWANNYGALLQSWALKTFLQKHGVRVKFINLVPVALPKGIRAWWHGRYFWFFRKFYLGIWDRCCKTPEKLRKKYRNIDTCVIGSDQVWNRRITGDFCFAYFGDFLFPSALPIPYAASVGEDSWPYTENETANIATLLSHVPEPLLVRENQLKIWCEEKIKVSSLLVCDPSLLNGDVSVLLNNKQARCGQGQIVSYKFSRSHEYYDFMQKLSAKFNLPVLLLADPVQKTGMRSVFKLSVNQWIGAITSGDLVITDSFHGLCLALLGHRDFLLLPNDKVKRNSRQLSLLEKLGLEDRMSLSYDEALEKAKKLPQIDYVKVDKLLEQWRQESGEALLKALEQAWNWKKSQ